MEGGLVTAIGAAAAGDIIWVKDTHSAAATRTIAGPNAAADFVNHVRVYGVLPATTNENGDVVKADLIPGIATDGKGTTPAYDHASAPKVATTSNLDIHFSGSIYFYGIWFESNDKLNCNTSNSALIFEECKLATVNNNDDIQFGINGNADEINQITCINSRLEVAGGTGSSIMLMGHPKIVIEGGIIDSDSLPIRLSPTPTICSVHPFS